jgi:Flp pilus assembly protein TadG
MRVRARSHRPACDERGAVAVEYGVVFPLIALLLAGFVYFGLAFNTLITLTSAAREGVRVYALIPGGDYTTATTNAAPNVSGITVTAGTMASGGAESSTPCNPSSPPSPAPQAWVRATTTFSPNLPVYSPSFTLSARGVMRCGG